MERDIEIHYGFKSAIVDAENEDESSFIKRISFDIFINDEDDENQLKIGTGRLQLIDLERHSRLTINEETDVCFWHIADCSHEFFQLFKSLFLSRSVARAYSIDFFDFKKPISRILKTDFFMLNFINLSRIEIDKEYQNKKIGSSVIKQLKQDFYDFGSFISTKPYPLEFEGKFDDENFSEEEYNFKQKKVNKFYTKNGFKKVGKSDIYILPI